MSLFAREKHRWCTCVGVIAVLAFGGVRDSHARKRGGSGRVALPTADVVLPSEFKRTRRYPVVIVLPYTGGTPVKFIRAYTGWRTNMGNVHRRFAALLKRVYPRAAVRKKRAFILLLPHGRGTEKHHNWRGFKRAIKLFERNVRRAMTRLSRKYRIDKKRVVFVGHSLGGDLSWALSLRNPDLVTGAVITGSRCSYRKPSDLPRLAKKGFRFYLAMGQREHPDRISGMNRAVRLLNRAGIKHQYVTIPNAGHDMLPLKSFVQALEFVLFK